MRILFFSGTDKSGRSAFRSYYILQNIKAVKTTSLIYFIFCVIIRVIFFSYHISSQTILHISDYDYANWIALFINPIFYILCIQFIKRFKPSYKFQAISQLLIYLFALFIIINGMRATFFSMYNPRNTMVTYMVALIIVGTFYVFEYYETIFIALATGIFFAVMLPFYQQRINELVLNNLASLLLITAFFFISRYMFSYKADNFFKLKAIAEKNLEIENASIAKNEILGVVAHDLRNPLAIIKSVTMLMEMDEDMSDEYRENFQMIKASCDKATSIINDLLETAQNEILNEFKLEKTELDGFIKVIVDEWLKNKKGQINILYHKAGRPVYGYINKEKMRRVMDNLISNAIKFSGVSKHIDISLTSTGNELLIKVKDFGMGIPDDLLPYIFDRFSRARRAGMRGEASVGLGLNIVQQIIRKHNGEIEVSSSEEHGTTFTIRLPLGS